MKWALVMGLAFWIGVSIRTGAAAFREALWRASRSAVVFSFPKVVKYNSVFMVLIGAQRPRWHYIF